MAMEHPIFFFGSDALPDLGEGVLPCFGCWMGRWLVLSSSGEQMAQRSQFTSVLGVAWNQQPCGEPARNFLVYWRCPSPKVTECSQLSYGPCGWTWCIPRPIKWFLASTPHQPGLKKKPDPGWDEFWWNPEPRCHFFHCPRCGSRVFIEINPTITGDPNKNAYQSEFLIKPTISIFMVTITAITGIWRCHFLIKKMHMALQYHHRLVDLVDISGDGLVNYLEPGIPETRGEFSFFFRSVREFSRFDGKWHGDFLGFRWNWRMWLTQFIFYGFYGILR